MEPRQVQSARREEHSAPGQWFAVYGDTVHVCAGRSARFAFCGKEVSAAWDLHDMTRWQTGWTICQNCGEAAAELEGLLGGRP